MKHIIILAALCLVGLTWTVRASNAAAPPADSSAEQAEPVDPKKAAVDAAKAFVADYEANAAAVKFKKSKRFHWLHLNKDRVRAVLPTLEEVSQTEPYIAWKAASIVSEYAAHMPKADAFKVKTAEIEKRTYAAHCAAVEAKFAADAATGRTDAAYKTWFIANLKKLSDKDAIAAIKAEARALAAVEQSPARDAFLQELLTTLAVLQKLQ